MARGDKTQTRTPSLRVGASFRTFWRRMYALRALAHAVALVLVGASAVRAEQAGPGVLILRSGAAPEEKALHRQVDEALTRALSASGFKAAAASPIPLEELELAVGCALATPECLRNVSAPLDTEWTLIRTLVRESSGAYQLGLLAQSRAADVPARRALATLSVAEQRAPEGVVAKLVTLIFPPHAPSGASPPPPRIPERDQGDGESRALRVLGWSSLAASAGLVTAGVALGVASRHDLSTYEEMSINTPADAEHAASLHDRAEQRAHIANGLLIGGASLGAAGAGLLVWNLVKSRHAKQRVNVSVSYTGSGGMLLLGGKLGRERL
jgi:hypothetical protein